MFSGGYTLKLLRIDLSAKSHRVEDIPETYCRTLLGGRGVAAKYYYDEIGPEVTPFSGENKLIFMNGPLTGAPVYSSTKFQLATKSPLTEHYICSNSSGNFGPELKCAGFDGIIVEGKATQPVYITIRDNEIKFHDASAIMGKTTVETNEYIKVNHGISKGIMSIGIGGELKVRYATV